MINAVDELYIAKRQPQDAAQCLIDVTIGSNMGASLAEALLISVACSLMPVLFQPRGRHSLHGFD